MKKPLAYAFVFFQIPGLLALQSVAADTAQSRPNARRLRCIMSTDFPPIGVVKGGDVPNDEKNGPDDMQSMVRFLLYAHEFDIEAFIATSGTFANQAKKQNILDVIGRYERVYDNLKRHTRECSVDVICFPTSPGSMRTIARTTDVSVMCTRTKEWDARECVKGIHQPSCGW